MHVLTQGGARCAEMDAAPHIFMRRADPRTHTHLHFRPLLMTPRAAEWSRWIIWNFEHGRACLHKRTELLKLTTSGPYFLFFFPPFAEWRPQCLFKTGFLIKSQRSRLGWRLHINCERSLNRILSNTILISTYSLALFSWCHIGVKSWIGLNIEGFFFVVHASLCVCVLPPTGEWDSANGSQSLAIINHLMYLFFFALPPMAIFPVFVSYTCIFLL